MLDAARSPSSAAAEAVEECLVDAQDAGDVIGLGRRVPLVQLEGPPEKDTVRTGEHVAVSGKSVADLRLRLEDCELPAGGPKLLIAEEFTRTEASAVEDERLGEEGNVRRRRKAPDFD